MTLLDYDEGYQQALIDVSLWISNPNKQTNKKLCTVNRLIVVMNYLVEHWEDLQKNPYEFEFEFEISKNKLVIK